MKGEYMPRNDVRIELRLPQRLLDAIQAAASLEGETVSEWIRMLVREKLVSLSPPQSVPGSESGVRRHRPPAEQPGG